MYMPSNKLMTRKEARELSLHLLFSMDFNLEDDIESQILSELDAERFTTLRSEHQLYSNLPDDKQKEYILKLVEGVTAHYIELNHFIEKYSVGWKLNRLSHVCGCILRICMYEIKYIDDIPSAASINEAIELAKKYESSETASFINGILGAFMREEMSVKE